MRGLFESIGAKSPELGRHLLVRIEVCEVRGGVSLIHLSDRIATRYPESIPTNRNFRRATA
jgi:hypothetical protein